MTLNQMLAAFELVISDKVDAPSAAQIVAKAKVMRKIKKTKTT